MSYNAYWNDNRGRGYGPRGASRGWRGNFSGFMQGGHSIGPPPFYPGPRRGFAGRGRGGNFNQIFQPRQQLWTPYRNEQSPSFHLEDESFNIPQLSQNKPFLSPPRSYQTPPKASSPLPGSEEYMQRNISEKSALLKRELELEGGLNNVGSIPSLDTESEFNLANTKQLDDNRRGGEEECTTPRSNKSKKPKQAQQSVQTTLNVHEIHAKIINHISRLSYNKKINIVNQSGPSGYDFAIQQITRQKRLDLSRALRDMCNDKFKESEESSAVIDSIIPDFEIKIDSLPRDLVQQLSSTLNEDVEESLQNVAPIDPEMLFQQAAAMLTDIDTIVEDDQNLSAFTIPKKQVPDVPIIPPFVEPPRFDVSQSSYAPMILSCPVPMFQPQLMLPNYGNDWVPVSNLPVIEPICDSAPPVNINVETEVPKKFDDAPAPITESKAITDSTLTDASSEFKEPGVENPLMLSNATVPLADTPIPSLDKVALQNDTDFETSNANFKVAEIETPVEIEPPVSDVIHNQTEMEKNNCNSNVTETKTNQKPTEDTPQITNSNEESKEDEHKVKESKGKGDDKKCEDKKSKDESTKIKSKTKRKSNKNDSGDFKETQRKTKRAIEQHETNKHYDSSDDVSTKDHSRSLSTEMDKVNRMCDKIIEETRSRSRSDEKGGGRRKNEKNRHDKSQTDRYDEGYRNYHQTEDDRDRQHRQSYDKYRERELAYTPDPEHASELHWYSKYAEWDKARSSKRYHYEKSAYLQRSKYADLNNDYQDDQDYEYYRHEMQLPVEDYDDLIPTHRHRTKHSKSHKKSSKKHKKRREVYSSSPNSNSSFSDDDTSNTRSSRQRSPEAVEERSTIKHKKPLKDRIKIMNELKSFDKGDGSNERSELESTKIKLEPLSPIEDKQQPSLPLEFRDTANAEESSSCSSLVLSNPTSSSPSLAPFINKPNPLSSTEYTNKTNDSTISFTNKSTSLPKTSVSSNNKLDSASSRVPFTNKPNPTISSPPALIPFSKKANPPSEISPQAVPFTNRQNPACSGSSQVPFTNKPNPASPPCTQSVVTTFTKKPNDLPSLVPFTNKPNPNTQPSEKSCVVQASPLSNEDSVPKEDAATVDNELPDINNITKIISNLSDIVKPDESENDNDEPIKTVQRPWKSPGEKKFMMEQLNTNQSQSICELDLHAETITDACKPDKENEPNDAKTTEILHSAEVSSTSDTSGKITTTVKPVKETTQTSSVIIAELQATEVENNMLITTYTQTADLEPPKVPKKTSSSSYSRRRRRLYNIGIQVGVPNHIKYTQTPLHKYKNVYVQVDINKSTTSKNVLSQTKTIALPGNDCKKNEQAPRPLSKSKRQRTIRRMLELDREIQKLTQLRQDLYKELETNTSSDDEPLVKKTPNTTNKLGDVEANSASEDERNSKRSSFSKSNKLVPGSSSDDESVEKLDAKKQTRNKTTKSSKIDYDVSSDDEEFDDKPNRKKSAMKKPNKKQKSKRKEPKNKKPKRNRTSKINTDGTIDVDDINNTNEPVLGSDNTQANAAQQGNIKVFTKASLKEHDTHLTPIDVETSSSSTPAIEHVTIRDSNVTAPKRTKSKKKRSEFEALLADQFALMPDVRANTRPRLRASQTLEKEIEIDEPCPKRFKYDALPDRNIDETSIDIKRIELLPDVGQEDKNMNENRLADGENGQTNAHAHLRLPKIVEVAGSVSDILKTASESLQNEFGELRSTEPSNKNKSGSDKDTFRKRKPAPKSKRRRKSLLSRQSNSDSDEFLKKRKRLKRKKKNKSLPLGRDSKRVEKIDDAIPSQVGFVKIARYSISQLEEIRNDLRINSNALVKPYLCNMTVNQIEINEDQFDEIGMKDVELVRNVEDEIKIETHEVEPLSMEEEAKATEVVETPVLFADENVFPNDGVEKIKNEIIEDNSKHQDESTSENTIDFKGFTGAILVIKVIKETVIAATDQGQLYFFSTTGGDFTHTFNIAKVAITSMLAIQHNDTYNIYVGSLNANLALINFDSKELCKEERLNEPIQCMENAWDCIFIGSDRGLLIRFDLNSEKVEGETKIAETNILMIKAASEGERKVLIVATKNEPVSIRDARDGLLLRLLAAPFSPITYSLLVDDDLVYCGTSQHDILVYTFEDGKLIFTHEANKSKGVACLQIAGNLLFAGCYNGNVYVYNRRTKTHLGTMTGPGGLLLSMEIISNKIIIVGTKSSNFKAWHIPQKYVDEM